MMNYEYATPVSQDGMGYYSAQPVRATASPRVITGATMDRSVVRREDGGVTGAWARVSLHDVHLGLEPEVKPKRTLMTAAAGGG